MDGRGSGRYGAAGFAGPVPLPYVRQIRPDVIRGHLAASRDGAAAGEAQSREITEVRQLPIAPVADQ
jgi:hypothetical protein